MTIFTSKSTDKKEDSNIPSPEVVSGYKLLVETEEKKQAVPVVVAVRPAPPAYPVAVGAGGLPHRRRRSLLKLWAALLAVVLVVIMTFICFMVYRTISATHARMMYRGRCGVRFHGDVLDGQAMPQTGSFEQEVTIEDMNYEKIEVPVIGDMRRSTVLHDFNQNLTAIVDRDQKYCFLLPLDRSLVMPPRDLWDLLVKLKTGYYIPDVDVIRADYRAITPAVGDVGVYGYNIWHECHLYKTYRLVREDEPIAMAKRSACEFVGEKWCLGDAGGKQMLCLRINGCI